MQRTVMIQFETRLPSSPAERFGTTEPMSLCEALKGGDGFKGLFTVFCLLLLFNNEAIVPAPRFAFVTVSRVIKNYLYFLMRFFQRYEK